MNEKSKVRTCLWFDNQGEEAAQRAHNAMMKMAKIDIAALESAFNGE
jgi:predicted 3-demethylubiquinone-9 3-methyltransferase (glyoxalase superfamily)